MRAWIMTAALALSGCGGGGGGTDASSVDGPVGGDVDAAAQCPEPAPPPDMCDYFLGCGCDTAAGDKCTVVGNARTCGAAGTSPAGTPCTTDPECASGTACLTVGPSGDRRCRIFCDDAHPCPTPDLACYIRIRDDAMPTPNVIGMACGQVCSLLDQDCTITGQACYYSGSVMEMEHGACATAGTLGQGESCMFSNDCLPGFTCIDPSGPNPSICAQFCDLTDGDPACTVGTCTVLTGHTQTGVCVTP